MIINNESNDAIFCYIFYAFHNIHLCIMFNNLWIYCRKIMPNMFKNRGLGDYHTSQAVRLNVCYHVYVTMNKVTHIGIGKSPN